MWCLTCALLSLFFLFVFGLYLCVCMCVLCVPFICCYLLSPICTLTLFSTISIGLPAIMSSKFQILYGFCKLASAMSKQLTNDIFIVSMMAALFPSYFPPYFVVLFSRVFFVFFFSP